jgi:signal transduction histidine kinase
MNRLFEAFERTKRAKQMGIEGTGLGLPISRYLVEAHGGEMRVETAVGHGSTFSFTLPLHHYVHETNGRERVH